MARARAAALSGPRTGILDAASRLACFDQVVFLAFLARIGSRTFDYTLLATIAFAALPALLPVGVFWSAVDSRWHVSLPRAHRHHVRGRCAPRVASSFAWLTTWHALPLCRRSSNLCWIRRVMQRTCFTPSGLWPPSPASNSASSVVRTWGRFYKCRGRRPKNARPRVLAFCLHLRSRPGGFDCESHVVRTMPGVDADVSGFLFSALHTAGETACLFAPGDTGKWVAVLMDDSQRVSKTKMAKKITMVASWLLV